MNLDSCQDDISVSIVMPCLNEVRSLAGCIGEAREALDEILERWGLNGEIVIADDVFFADPSGIRRSQQLEIEFVVGPVPEIQWVLERDR